MATDRSADEPLSTLLSRVLVAFTIEFDNEAEHQLPHTTSRGPAASSRQGPWLVSLPMWANFLRLLDAPGLPLRDLQEQASLVNLAGLQRWGYITVAPDPADARPDPPRRDWLVRPTPAGQRAQDVWRPLAGHIETRWQQRWGAADIDRLRGCLGALVAALDVQLPRYLPVAGLYRQDPGHWPPASPAAGQWAALDLSALLSQVLLAFAVDYENSSRLSLALSANVLRVLDEPGVRVADLPALTGVSREAVSGSVKFLQRHDCAVVGPDPAGGRRQVARLTAKGRRAQDGYHRRQADVQQRWRERFGGPQIDRLRRALEEITDCRDGDQPCLSRALTPYPDGWRAHPPYLALTRAMIAEPRAALPHYPMVSHRGGFPDGS